MIGPKSFLAYGGYRYLVLTLLGLAVAIAFYLRDEPLGGPSGGTWYGYTLGGVCLALIFWLLWYGVRKRSFRAAGAPLQAWLSAHVYLGTALLVLVPLHAGFQFGWNVHTLAYVLLCGTVATGLGAVLAYRVVPPNMTDNRSGESLDALLQQIADIDGDCRSEAAGMPDVFARAVAVSITETRIGGGLLRQFAAMDRRCGTRRAIEMLRGRTENLDAERLERRRHLMELLGSKQTLLGTVRRDMRYKAMLDVWILLHVPLSLATLAAVAVHVLAVFYYW